MEKAIHPVDQHVGQRVRFFRLCRGLSQVSLAAKLGVSFQQLQKYESGANRVSASRMYDICGALGIAVADLFEGVGGDVSVDEVREAAPEDVELVSALAAIDNEPFKKRVRALIAEYARASGTLDSHPASQ